MALTTSSKSSFESRYLMVSKDRYKNLMDRIEQFTATAGDPTTEPVQVFEPLSQWQVDDLLMIRQMSHELQAKKDEDMRRAAQAAEEAQQESKEETKEQKEEQNEEAMPAAQDDTDQQEENKK